MKKNYFQKKAKKTNNLLVRDEFDFHKNEFSIFYNNYNTLINRKWN